MTAPSITAILLSFNEEIHIARCIERLRPIAGRIVVIDSGSTDRTVEIAKATGAEVLHHAFVNHAAQLAWGLDAAKVATDWVLRIDCDEYLEPALIAQVERELPVLGVDIGAVEFRLKVIFKGRFIRWGGYHRTWLARLWRPEAGAIEQRWLDERLKVTRGRTVAMRDGDLVDESLKDIGWWTAKHNDYATRQMIDFIGREHGLIAARGDDERSMTRRTRWRRFLRNGVYARTPLYLRAVLYWLQRYVLRLGFLDGRQGFVWHFLQGFWFFILADAKIDEARHFIRAHGVDAFPGYLRDRYGIADAYGRRA